MPRIGRLLAEIMGISRQAVSQHFQSGQRDHRRWFMDRAVKQLSSVCRPHSGMNREAVITLAKRAAGMVSKSWEIALASYATIHTTDRWGTDRVRKRALGPAFEALAEVTDTPADKWALRAVTEAFKVLLGQHLQILVVQDPAVQSSTQPLMSGSVTSQGFNSQPLVS